MSKHRTFAIAPSFHNGIVFKRKGKRVRYIDPATAKVSGWVADPEAPITGAEAIREALGVPRREDGTALSVAIRVVPNPAYLPKTRGTVDYQRMTVAELRALAGDRGIKVPSKTRKADIIAALIEEN